MTAASAHYIETASLILANCRSYDPMFAKASDSMALAWARVFEKSGMSRADLLAGVDYAYLKAEEGFRPLAATIVQKAQAAYFEALKELPDERRAMMEEANHALQDMGFAPNQAHRYSRAIALGRKADLILTAEQDTSLRAMLAKARERLNEPPRQLESLWTVRPDWKPGTHRRDPAKAFEAIELPVKSDAAEGDERQDDAA